MSISEFIALHFKEIQMGILILGAGTAYYIFQRNSGPSTQFRKREADRADLDQILKSPSSLASAKLQKKSSSPPPLHLPGVRLSGEPHEILGVKEDATEAEVLKAYKETIKRFHPDRIQGVPQDQMKFYEEASATLNRAKEECLAKMKSSKK